MATWAISTCVNVLPNGEACDGCVGTTLLIGFLCTTNSLSLSLSLCGWVWVGVVCGWVWVWVGVGCGCVGGGCVLCAVLGDLCVSLSYRL